MAYVFDEPAWPPGNDWPPGALPPPRLTLELSGLEIQALIRTHDDYAGEAERGHEHETELFHKARASYLRQRLGAVAPHMISELRAGRA